MDNNQDSQQELLPKISITINEQYYDEFYDKDGNTNDTFVNDLLKMESKNNCKTEIGHVNSLKKDTNDSSKFSLDSNDILSISSSKKDKDEKKKEKKKKKNMKGNGGCEKDSIFINLKESDEESDDSSDKIIKNISNRYFIRQIKIQEENAKIDASLNDSSIAHKKDLMNELGKLDEKNKNKILPKTYYKAASNLVKCIESEAENKYKCKLKYICNKNLNEKIFEKEKILKENIRDLFLGEFSLLDPQQKIEAEKEKETLLNMEKEKNKNKFNKLESLFNVKIEDIKRMYLHNSRYASYGNASFLIKEFKTFKDDHGECGREKILDIPNLLLNSKTTDINYFNSNKKIFNVGLNSIYSFFSDYVKKKYKIQLVEPTLCHICNYTTKSYEDIFKKKLKFIFDTIETKRKIKDENNSSIIDEILKKEGKEEKEGNRMLNVLLNSITIYEVMRDYINDQKINKKKDNNGNEFEYRLDKTYSDLDFPDCSKEKMELRKKKFIDLLEGKIKSRKSKKKTKLGEKKILGKKAKRS